MDKLMVHPEFANIEILIEIAKLNYTHTFCFPQGGTNLKKKSRAGPVKRVNSLGGSSVDCDDSMRALVLVADLNLPHVNSLQHQYGTAAI